MTRSWTEGGATWNNTFWDNGGFAPATGFFPIAPGQGGVVSFDVTNDVNGFLAGTFTNLGWMIGQDPFSGSSCSLDFNSREAANGLTVGPKLVITLNPICTCTDRACGADDGCGNECPGTCPGTESCSSIGDDQFMCFEDLDWASRRDLTDQRFSELFAQYRDRGWMITDVDA